MDTSRFDSTDTSPSPSEIACTLTRAVSPLQAADDAVVVHQLAQDLPGQDTLGAMRRVDLASQFRAHGNNDFLHALGGAHGRGGLQDDQVVFAQIWRNGTRGGLDIGQIRCLGVAVHLFEWRGHRQDERVALLGRQGRLQVAAVDCRLDEDVQVWFDDVDAARIDDVNGLCVDIDAKHLVALGGQHGGRWQANVAQAHHDDFL